MALAEIARARGLTRQTIENHMAHWVGEGRIAIERLVDESRRLAIEQAFAAAGTSPLKRVKEELGPEYSYSELNLVRAALNRDNRGRG